MPPKTQRTLSSATHWKLLPTSGRIPAVPIPAAEVSTNEISGNIVDDFEDDSECRERKEKN